MKQRLTFFLLLLSLGLSAQTLFVKAGAAGLNNGTSWLNAYTSLDVALTAALPGQSIWVAAGTYKPLTPAPNNSFYVASGVELYGGFSGTETTLNQRNIAANATILSGDILGNDVTGNFTTNRTDNVQHVIVGLVVTTNPGLTIDGFTVRGGQTLTGTANADVTRRGGGLILMAKGTIRNCTFTDNFGESGAAVAVLDALTDGVLIENCTFESNKATEDAVCFLRSTPTGSIKNCTFRKNVTKRGALYPANSTAMVIDGCLFESNLSKGTAAAPNFGAGMFTWQSTFVLSNSIFRKNNADNGAGLYVDGRDGGDVANIVNCLFENDTVSSSGAGMYTNQATMNIKGTTFRANYANTAAGMFCDGREHDSSYSLDSCTFENNVASGYGCTAIWNIQTNFTISNSSFKNNVAPSSGAAMYNSDLTTFTVSNTLFEGNTANYAGAIANYGLGCIGTFQGCTFRANIATNGGGAVSNGFKADVTYKDCDFLSNMGNFGGAIFTQNDTSRVTVDGCYFNDNTASGTSGNAGCILVNSNIHASITNTTFFQNSAVTGGAISANGDSAIIIDKCKFLENVATTQGAAVNFNHIKAQITNSLFAKNVNTSSEFAGGAISNNASDNELSKITAINCTFADNFAPIGAGISQWESTVGNSELHLQNCLFQNNDGGENYSIEDGAPEVISMNGNQSSDATLETYLTQSKDMNSTFNTFQDADNNNYAHTLASPASDGGVAAGAPADDINGVSRAGTPDVGAYEVKTTGTHSIEAQILPMKCSPNPATDLTVISLQNDRNGKVQITVWNQLGQKAAEYVSEKTAENFSFPMQVSQLAAGTYRVQVRMGATIHEGAFAKF